LQRLQQQQQQRQPQQQQPQPQQPQPQQPQPQQQQLALARARKCSDIALILLWERPQLRLLPDEICFNAGISVREKGQWEAVLCLLREMPQLRPLPKVSASMLA
jgi:hypothetical protein